MSAFCNDVLSSILVSVIVLVRTVSHVFGNQLARTYSTSNQLGVMMVAFGSKER